MKQHRLTVFIAIALVASLSAVAQSAQPLEPLMIDLAPTVQQAGGIQFVSGGAGEESRAALDAMRADFTVRNVFSGPGGEYVVAERVTVTSAAGGEAMSLSNVGPIMMAKLPPGRYTVTADYHGRTQSKTVQVGSGLQNLAWSWPNVHEASPDTSNAVPPVPAR